MFVLYGLGVVGACGSGSDNIAPPAANPPPASSSGFTPSPIAEPRVPAGERLVTEFGALPDDGVDDTAAIQAALDAVNAAGGGTLVFPAGRFDIRINPTLSRALTLYPRVRLLGRPAGQATLRLADQQIVYESIMATASYPTRLDDAAFEGLVFDSNSLNNPVRDARETNGDLGTPTFRYVIRSFAGSRVLVRNCTFVNNDNGNTVSFNGVDISDVVIEQNKFLNVGGALIDHDHSSVYADGLRIRIANNEFRSRFGAGTLGARTAIETHSDDEEVRGNTIHGFLQGANAVSLVSLPSRQLYLDNTFSAVAVGINIWPVALGLVSTTAPAYTALVLKGNVINIDADTWWASPAMVINQPAGIHFEADVANARLARLEIVDNRITFDTYAGRRPDADRYSAGIELRGVTGRLAVDVLTLSRNSVRNSIGPGILSLVPVGSGEASVMADNTLIDTGRGPNLVGAGDLLRSGVVIGVTSRKLALERNSISSTGSPGATTLNGVLLGSECLDNNCSISGTTSSGLQTPVSISGSGWINRGP